MKKEKWNYAIVKNIFGEYWIGKTKLSTKKDCIFSSFEEAKEEALRLAYSYTNHEEIECGEETECERITKPLEKFIIH